MMEMQARLTADRWLHEVPPATKRPYEDPEKLVQLRAAMQQKGLDVPQYWFGDYLGYIEDIASHLQLQRNNGLFAEREGCPSPARYSTAKTDEVQAANAIMSDLHDLWHDCVDNGRFVARAALRAMHGDWEISRRTYPQPVHQLGMICSETRFSEALQDEHAAAQFSISKIPHFYVPESVPCPKQSDIH